MGFILGVKRWPRLAATWRHSSFFSRWRGGGCRAIGRDLTQVSRRALPHYAGLNEETLWQSFAFPRRSELNLSSETPALTESSTMRPKSALNFWRWGSTTSAGVLIAWALRRL